MQVHLVDGTYELFRYHFALPSHVTAAGQEVGATRGVAGSMLQLLEEGATHVGIATDHIVARGNSITGSVGVIFQWADVSDLLGKLGVKVEEVKSGPLKAVPTPFKPTDEQGLQATSELVAESQVWFLSLVTERRKISPETLDQVKTGRIFTGRQALANGLVDAIGDEDTARTWLNEQKKVSTELRVIDWEQEKTGAKGLVSIAGRAVASIFRPLLPDSLNFFDENGAVALRGLDGMVSVWQLQKAQ
jgi:protease-4